MKIRTTLYSFFLVVFTITITYFFITPVLNTQDDTFVEYMLAKGFSAATIPVTYFEYGFLFYEKPFAFLYAHSPALNWLSIFYVLLHSLSAIIIVNFLLRTKRIFINILSITIYIFLFFIPLITKLSYTTAAGHCIIACLFIFIDSVLKKEKPSIKKRILVAVLLIVALGLRMHIAIPLAIIVLPFLFFRKEILKQWLSTYSVVIIIISTSFFLHENNYAKNIPNWKNIQPLTNAVYQLGNYGFDKHTLNAEKDTFKKSAFNVINNNYLYDDTLLNSQLLADMKSFADKKIIGNKMEVYWLVTDIKQFLLLLFPAIIWVCFYEHNKKIRLIILLSNAAAAIASAYLILFMKFPERIWLLIFLLLFLITFYQLRYIQWKIINLPFKIIFISCMVATSYIQSLRIIDIKDENKIESENFICANNFLKQHPDVLFVEYNESYPFNNFPAFCSPSQYHFTNILFPFFLNTELRKNTMDKYHITNVSAALCSSKNIILVGKPDKNLIAYIYETQNILISFKKIYPNACLDLYEADIK